MVGISQIMVFCIEGGFVDLIFEIIVVLEKLCKNFVICSMFDDFVVLIEYSFYYCFLLDIDNEILLIEMMSELMCVCIGDVCVLVNVCLGEEVIQYIIVLIDCGFFNGCIESVVGSWKDVGNLL